MGWYERERESESCIWERERERFQNHYFLALAGDNAEIKLKQKNYLYVIMQTQPPVWELNTYPVLEWKFCKIFSGFWKQPICIFKVFRIYSIFWSWSLQTKHLKCYLYFIIHIQWMLKKIEDFSKKRVKVHLDWSKEFITAKKNSQLSCC